jgi:hypothetical protein
MPAAGGPATFSTVSTISVPIPTSGQQPPGAAVVFGQQINPRMNPPVELYQYSRQSAPRYRHALSLQE